VQQKISPGDLIIAPPRIPDSRFKETVIMITHHDQISLGFCINRPLGITLQSVISGMDLDPDLDPEIYWGGPVNPNTVWIIHDRSWQHDHSLRIDSHWSMVSHQGMFDRFTLDSQPNNYRVVMGCASWAPEQLESEIDGLPPWSLDHSWLCLNEPSPDLITLTAVDDLWRRAAEQSLRQAVNSVMN